MEYDYVSNGSHVETVGSLEGDGGQDIRDWQEDAVNGLLRSLGFPYYEQQIRGARLIISKKLL